MGIDKQGGRLPPATSPEGRKLAEQAIANAKATEQAIEEERLAHRTERAKQDLAADSKTRATKAFRSVARQKRWWQFWK
jgi:hypothetical protein